MPVDRSALPGTALPPTDHVARVLLKLGARDEALDLLRAAIARDPGEKACAALLRAVEARPDASVYGPDLDIGFALVQAYTQSGMLVEALAVLRGVQLDSTPEGQERGEALRALLAPVPPTADPGLREVDAQIRNGGAAIALTMLDQRVADGAAMPDWAKQRHALLSALLLDQAQAAPEGTGLKPRTALGKALAEHLARRDLSGALEAARQYSMDHPDSGDAAAAVVSLGRLAEGMNAMTREFPGNVFSTQPMTGHNVGLFQLRMGNIDVSERLFRKMLLEAPMDDLARQRLDDIQTVRHAIEGTRAAVTASAPTALEEVDPLMQTMAQAMGDILPLVMAPEPPSAAAGGLDGPTSPSVELPDGEPLPLEEEPTRRVSREEVMRRGEGMEAAAQPARSSLAHLLDEDETRRGRLPSPDLLAQAILEEETREVRVGVPPEARRPPTSPELLKKRQRRPGVDGGYVEAPAPRPSDWDEEVSTEIGTPDQQAELLLKQGFTRQAIDMFERLVKTFPEQPRYAQRLEEIRRIAEQEASGPHRSPEAGALSKGVDDALAPEPPTTRISVDDVKDAVAKAAFPAFDEIPPTLQAPRERLAEAMAAAPVPARSFPRPSAAEPPAAVGASPPVEDEWSEEPTRVSDHEIGIDPLGATDEREATRASVAVHRIIAVG